MSVPFLYFSGLPSFFIDYIIHMCVCVFFSLSIVSSTGDGNSEPKIPRKKRLDSGGGIICWRKKRNGCLRIVRHLLDHGQPKRLEAMNSQTTEELVRASTFNSATAAFCDDDREKREKKVHGPITPPAFSTLLSVVRVIMTFSPIES